MPLGNNPNFSQVKAFFNGSNSLKDYVRGGLYVPNIPANYNIPTTPAGLSLKAFSGADKVTLPPTPTLLDTGGSDYIQSNSSAASAVSVEIRDNGFVWVGTNNSGSGNQYQWLPSGRGATEYQYRLSNDSVTWSGWVTLGGNPLVLSVSAQTDGFFSDYQEQTVYVQLGAQGTALTGVATFNANATANGHG